MKNTIVVTGATGNIGQELAARLLSRGHAVRAVARGAEKLAALGAKGAELKAGSLDDRRFLTEAFRGATAVFAMLPPNYGATDFHAAQRKIAESIVGAIQDAGVKRVVTLSSVGAEQASGTGPILGLHVLEKLVDAVAGLDVVHLRPAYFMENLLGSVGLIKSAGINGSPMKSDLPVSMVATRDIAAAASQYLDEARFKGRAVAYLFGAKD